MSTKTFSPLSITSVVTFDTCPRVLWYIHWYIPFQFKHFTDWIKKKTFSQTQNLWPTKSGRKIPTFLILPLFSFSYLSISIILILSFGVPYLHPHLFLSLPHLVQRLFQLFLYNFKRKIFFHTNFVCEEQQKLWFVNPLQNLTTSWTCYVHGRYQWWVRGMFMVFGMYQKWSNTYQESV